MDRNFFLQKSAQEHQLGISRLLANRRLLKNPEGPVLQTAKKGNALILRYGPAVTILTILIVLGILI